MFETGKWYWYRRNADDSNTIIFIIYLSPGEETTYSGYGLRLFPDHIVFSIMSSPDHWNKNVVFPLGDASEGRDRSQLFNRYWKRANKKTVFDEIFK
jgi:hypothetical protein